MNEINFTWQGPESLESELIKPLRRLSFRVAPHGRVISVTLWHEDGTGIRIRSQMHDVAERVEVGVLNFDVVEKMTEDEKVVDVAASFGQIKKATKLTVQEADSLAESGIVLQAADDSSITIVAGADPCSLAIESVDLESNVPEYPLERYRRVPFE